MKIDQRDADAALGGEVHAHSSWILPLLLLVIAARLAAASSFSGRPDGRGSLRATRPRRPPRPTPPICASTAFRSASLPTTRSSAARAATANRTTCRCTRCCPTCRRGRPATPKRSRAMRRTAKSIHFTLAIDRAPPDLSAENSNAASNRAADNPEGAPGPFGLTNSNSAPAPATRTRNGSPRRSKTVPNSSCAATRRPTRLRLKLHARDAPAGQCRAHLPIQARASRAVETDRRRRDAAWSRRFASRNRLYGFFITADAGGRSISRIAISK